MTSDANPSPLAAAAAPETFGEVAPDGTVFLRLPDGSMREVGQWAAGESSAALAFFSRKYTDVVTEIDVAAKRLADDRSSPADAEAVVSRIRESILNPSFVGDMGALVARVGQLEVLISVKKQALAEAKQQRREQAITDRQALVKEAQELASSQSWRVTTERFKEIVEAWKAIPRVDRSQEDEMWQQIKAARNNFDKARRAHYQELETARKEAKERKLELIKQAQALANSKEWNKTTGAYRDLLEKWKKAGRAGKEDDALWEKFRAAQDGFFAARSEAFAKRDESERAALAVKEELLTEAAKLVPVKNLAATKKSLRSIQQRWDSAGHVPKSDVKRLEGQLKKIEDAVREADQSRWQRANPELAGRASETVNRFAESVAKLERELAKATESGNAAAIQKAQSALEGAQALLAAAQQASEKLTK